MYMYRYAYIHVRKTYYLRLLSNFKMLLGGLQYLIVGRKLKEFFLIFLKNFIQETVLNIKDNI